jgi:Zn finger protein HypA/HybF involved in hydrogenase expression
MHEMSIAASMLDVVLQAAEQAGATRVEAVEVEVGAMKLVVPEVLQVAWEAVRADTLADASAGGSSSRTSSTASCARAATGRTCGLSVATI